MGGTTTVEPTIRTTTKNQPKTALEKKASGFHGVLADFVFTTIHDDFRPIASNNGPRPTQSTKTPTPTPTASQENFNRNSGMNRRNCQSIQPPTTVLSR